MGVHDLLGAGFSVSQAVTIFGALIGIRDRADVLSTGVSGLMTEALFKLIEGTGTIDDLTDTGFTPLQVQAISAIFGTPHPSTVTFDAVVTKWDSTLVTFDATV